MSQLIQIENIQVQQKATDWEDAIRRAGQLLFENGSVDTAYIDMMVQAIHDMGPYIVIAPHIAFAHARPSESVKKNDISLITLESPVPFGSEHNDPVNIVFAFCATEDGGHLEQLTSLASLLDNPNVLNGLNESKSNEEIYQLLNQSTKGEK
ncbi:PTS sugar transporter subunit IIA [Heyndrickxia oleronia]|uniref:Ascorbate-specific PTS system EIIA component n=1 Tax=Heyndrickxia oleronia TaxID=38875 RepID=A0AAW6SYP7_9BACI|nr:PTS sugar transporter subunit IIA [Heyndrickxia oleronia]MDH5162149.1 PTS sugar transporter subunit IIA [Heyndrickxia oleronia]